MDPWSKSLRGADSGRTLPSVKGGSSKPRRFPLASVPSKAAHPRGPPAAPVAAPEASLPYVAAPESTPTEIANGNEKDDGGAVELAPNLPPKKCAVEIIEISSDEDYEPIPPRNISTSKLQAKIRELEKENARIKAENKEKEKARLQKESEEKKKQQAVADDLEDQISCELCSFKLWTPFILPDFGHTFCQEDLESWFSMAVKQNQAACPSCALSI